MEVKGAGHIINIRTRITGWQYPCVDPIDLVSNIVHGTDNRVYPAKPLHKYAPGVRQRLHAAWLVLIGKAAAVYWMAHD